MLLGIGGSQQLVCGLVSERGREYHGIGVVRGERGTSGVGVS